MAQKSIFFGPVFPTEAEPPAPSPTAPGAGLQPPPSIFFGGPATDEQLAQRVGEARTASPDTAARIWSLQQKTGLPGPVIADHLDEIEREVAQRNFDAAKFRRESPHLAAWLQEDEQQAAIANDDMANLGLLEWLVDGRWRGAFTRGQAQVELAQLRTRDLFGMPLTAAEHQRLAELKRQTASRNEFGVGDSWFRGAVTGTAEQLPILYGGVLKGAERAAIAGPTAGTMAAIAAPLTGPATLFTVPAMTAGGVTAGFLAGGAEFGFELEAGLAYDEFLEVKDELGHTIDPDVARAAAIGVGVANAALEAFGLGKFVQMFPGAKQVTAAFSRPAVKAALRSPTVRAALGRAAKAYAGNLTLETAVELAQEVFTIVGGEAAKAASGVEGATGEEIVSRAGSTIVQAAQSFTLLSALGPGLGVRGDLRAARQAEHNQTFFTALGEGVAQSKTAGRNADAVQSFLAKATKDGPLADVYAPVESWTQYWQSKNLDPAQMATELTGDADAYARALREGTDLVIPTARYAAKLAGTEHNAFFAQELRTGPDQPNFREAKAIRAAVEARMKAAAAEAEATPEASAARQALLSELEAKGLAPDEAARVADLHGAIVGTIGERAGRTEESLVADYPIGVTRPGFEGFETVAPEGGIPPSTAPATETPEQRGARRAGHYAALTQTIVRDAVAQDPNVDVAALQDQIAFRLAMAEAGQEALGASGEDPGNLLRAIAAEGGLWWDPRTEGEKGEIEDLMARGVDARQRASVLTAGKRRIVGAQTWQGVEGVFREGGKSPDAMIEALRQDPRFEHLTTFTDLFDALGKALSERAQQVDVNRFPGTADLASQLGIRLGERWWEQTGRRRATTAEDVVLGEAAGETPAAGEAEVSDAVDTGEGDTSFEFEQGPVLVPGAGEAREALLTKAKALYLQRGGGNSQVRMARALMDVGVKLPTKTAAEKRSATALVTRLMGEAEATSRMDPDSPFAARAAEIREALRAQPAEPATVAPGTATLEYEQRKGARGKRGFIKFGAGRGPRRFEIGLLKTADPSTLLHELGHFYLEVLGDQAEALAAQDPATLSETQQQLVADYQAFLQFLGVESRDAITTDHHEKFARAFEAYLYEGKAPSVELRSAFASFAAWLTRVYRSIRALDVELSPEVRGLFDRLAATDEAIATARSEADVTPLFTDAESAGMTELEFAAYQDEVREAHAREEETLRTKVLADLRRADQAWWVKAKDAMTATVTAELQQEPVYRAMSVMRTGAYPDGTPFVEGEDPPIPIKLSRDSLVAHYGKAILAQLPRPYLYAKDSGITADTAAENHGFSSGDELLKAIIEAVPFHEAVAREVDRRMLAEYGDIFTDGRLEAEAAAIVQGGEHRQQIVQAELKALTKGLARSTIPSAAVLNEAARRQVAATKIRDLGPGLHLQAARRASRQAFELMATGQDRAGAVRAKLQELINLALYREARDTLERVESMRRTMRGYRSTAARQRFGKAGADYLTQIDALLDRYELARVTQKELAGRVTLDAFVKAQQAADIPIEIPQTLLDEARRINYLDVPVGEFTDVYDAVEHLARLSRLKNELLKLAKRRTFEEKRDTLVGSILLHNDKQPTRVEFRPEDERRDFINDMFASHTKLAIHARALDGFQDGGEMWELIRAINEAGDAEAVMREDAITRMAALFKSAYPGLELGRLNRKLFIKEIGMSLSKEGRLLVALNWGNEDNRQRLLNDPKRQWNAAQIQAILETLDRRDWEFVQGVWDYIDTFWPAIKAKQERVVGLAPEKVVATPVDTKFGQFRGGYFPIKYDGRLVARAGVLKETGEATLKTFAAYVSATTRRGHTQARVDNVKMAVRLDFSVLFNHVDQVIHDLTHHEMLIDVNRLLEDREVQAAIVDTRGHQVYKQFVHGLESIAIGAAPAKNWMERAANFSRGGTQVALLGLNFWTALQQPLGLFNGMSRVGPKWVIRGMNRWLRDAATMQSTVGWIHTKSAFMKDRATGGATQDLQDLRATLSRPNSYFDVLVRTVTKDHVTQQNILNSFLWHITQAQKIADVPTWIGAYEKHMAAGDLTLSVEELEARAVALADQAVRDSQGSGRISDLAHVQRGGPIAKLFMTFYSYGNTLFNQTVEVYGRTEPSLKRPGNAAAFIGHLSLLYAFPALGLVVMSRALGRTGGDEDDDSFFVEFGKEMLSAALNTMVLVRELGGLLLEGARGYAGPAGTRLLQASIQLGQQIKQWEIDDALVGASTNVAGIIFRFPATQVQRTVEGFMALQEGRTRNPAVLLTGPPRE